MKKFILIVFLLPNILLAQDAVVQKKFFVSGTLQNYGYTENDTAKTKRYSMGNSIIVGYNINQKWVAGIALTVGRNNNSSPNYEKVSDMTYSPFVRMMQPINKQFSYYVEGSLGYRMRKQSPVDNQQILSLNLKPGLFYQLTPRWALNTDASAISYTRTKYTFNSNVGKSSDLNLSLGASFNVGVIYCFNLKK